MSGGPGAGGAWRRLSLLPALLWMALIFGLSSLSNPLPSLTANVWDKALHLVEYGVLGASVALALLAHGAGDRRTIAIAAVASSLYGASDELHQWFVPGRSCDARDWLADSLGGLLGAAAFTLALRVARRRASIRRARGRA